MQNIFAHYSSITLGFGLNSLSNNNLFLEVTLIIFLDESGDLGFDFSRTGVSSHLIMACLICYSPQAIHSINRAVKLTLKNKLPMTIMEVKGGNTALSIKKYFFKHLEQNSEWKIMTIAANKKAWLRNNDNPIPKIDKNLFYDEVAKRLLSQVEITRDSEQIQLIVDKSKTPSALNDFNQRILSTFSMSIPEKTLFSIAHRHSYTETGLQAIDLFSWGIFRKYQHLDNTWYDIFKHRIALEMEFNF